MVKDAHTSGKKAFALSFHGSRSIFLRLVSAYLKSLLNRSRTILWYLNGEIITDNRQTLIHKSSPTTTTAFVPGTAFSELTHRHEEIWSGSQPFWEASFVWVTPWDLDLATSSLDFLVLLQP